MALPIPPPELTLTGGAGGSSGPSSADSFGGFNSSGWNVNYGSGGINTGNQQLLTYAAIAIAAYVIWKHFSKRG